MFIKAVDHNVGQTKRYHKRETQGQLNCVHFGKVPPSLGVMEARAAEARGDAIFWTPDYIEN